MQASRWLKLPSQEQSHYKIRKTIQNSTTLIAFNRLYTLYRIGFSRYIVIGHNIIIRYIVVFVIVIVIVVIVIIVIVIITVVIVVIIVAVVTRVFINLVEEVL